MANTKVKFDLCYVFAVGHDKPDKSFKTAKTNCKVTRYNGCLLLNSTKFFYNYNCRSHVCVGHLCLPADSKYRYSILNMFSNQSSM